MWGVLLAWKLAAVLVPTLVDGSFLWMDLEFLLERITVIWRASPFII